MIRGLGEPFFLNLFSNFKWVRRPFAFLVEAGLLFFFELNEESLVGLFW